VNGRRAFYLAVMAACALAALAHAGALHWGRFAAAFVLIDLIGYLPGAWAFRRARGAPIAPLYHHLYNVTHSFYTAAAALLIWAGIGGGAEWAMLAIPLHLAGDRGLLGNGPKPAHRPFETRAPEAAS
jgi:hypothetical protein